MTDDPFCSDEELAAIGLRSWGDDVKLSRKASFYGAENIEMGSHLRVDDFCVITAAPGSTVRLGNHVHIGVHSALIGRGGIVLEDFAGVSMHCSLLSASDDFSGEWMTNPTVPDEWTGVTDAAIHLGRHALIGAHCVVLPGVTIGEGAAVGAMSLVNRSLEPWGIYAGRPARFLRPRSKRLLELERELRSRESQG